MIKFSKHTFLLIVVFSVFTMSLSFGQSKKQLQLEAQRQEILKDIKEINSLLSSAKKEKTSVLTQIEDVNLKIKVNQNLIRVTNEQANLLTREIKQNNKTIIVLEADLNARKKDYANVVVNSYKNNAKRSKLMFLLSSDDFLQAYKRYNYMKQYKNFQKKLVDSIVSKTEKLHSINASLLVQKEDKDKLISENKRTKKVLQLEKDKQRSLIASIKKDQAKYLKIIAKKEKESRKIDARIDKLISEAIAKSNKKAGKKEGAKTFALTAEAKKLAASFSANRGKLPWPILKGRVTKRFGTSPHPTLPGIKQYCSGVEITTPINSRVRSVFSGTVAAILKVRGGGQGVLIKHGNYITVYSNLKEVFVKKGDQITTKQDIGVVITNIDGKNVLKFIIAKNNTKLNPVKWVYKML